MTVPCKFAAVSQLGTTPEPPSCCRREQQPQEPLSDPGRIGFRNLAAFPEAGALQWLDSARRVVVEDGVELLGDDGFEIVAEPLGLRSIDNTDRPLQPGLS